MPSLSFLTVSTTDPFGSSSWKLNSSAAKSFPFNCLETSNETSVEREPELIPSVVVNGAKPSTSKFSVEVVILTLLKAFFVVLSTGAVIRVL